MSTNKINKNLSIVIATLGGDSLFKTLTLINKSSTVPSEIFVCSPHIETQIYIPINKNIKFLLTKNFGQVAQRVEGLLKVSSSIVLQMDDDIFVNSDTIELLLKALNKCGKGYAISPVFCNSNSMELLTKYKTGVSGIIRNIIDYIVFGSYWNQRKMGTISKSGTPFYYDFNFVDQDLISSEWLPGGMVVCHRIDLVLENYYPFNGKAYFEDVIHSIIWRNNGIKLMVANIVVPTVVSNQKTTFRDLMREHRARKYVVTILNYRTLYCLFTFFYSLLVFFCRNIFKLIILLINFNDKSKLNNSSKK